MSPRSAGCADTGAARTGVGTGVPAAEAWGREPQALSNRAPATVAPRSRPDFFERIGERDMLQEPPLGWAPLDGMVVASACPSAANGNAGRSEVDMPWFNVAT